MLGAPSLLTNSSPLFPALSDRSLSAPLSKRQPRVCSSFPFPPRQIPRLLVIEADRACSFASRSRNIAAITALPTKCPRKRTRIERGAPRQSASRNCTAAGAEKILLASGFLVLCLLNALSLSPVSFVGGKYGNQTWRSKIGRKEIRTSGLGSLRCRIWFKTLIKCRSVM